MLIFPNCKINLGLSVTDKRADGFHNIETVLFPVNLSDILEIIKSPDGHFSFTQSGLKISGSLQNNLVVKAFQLLKNKYQLPEVHIHLHKLIPMGAGLGGGSADAAFAIKLLNDVFEINLSEDKMEDITRQLGSDCAFFIRNQSTLAIEKGDIFEQISLDLSGFYLSIIKPNIHIGTPEAYSWIKPTIKANSLKDIINLPINKWKDDLHNDFEDKIFKRYPEIESVKSKLYNLGAIYASMTGSGAAVFGLFENEIDLSQEFSDCFTWQGKVENH